MNGRGWLYRITDSGDMNLSKLWEIVEVGEAWNAAWGYKESDTTQQLNKPLYKCVFFSIIIIIAFIYLRKSNF